MISLHLEKFQSIHDEQFYPCVIISVNEQRCLSTEDLSYILQSPVTLAKEDTTLVIEWDRNYTEGVSLDKDMLHLIESPLYLHRMGEIVVLEHEGDDGRDVLTAVPFSEWKAEVASLKKLHDAGIYRCSISI